jgi:peptide-methionine (S)-S-oxide reductase
MDYKEILSHIWNANRQARLRFWQLPEETQNAVTDKMTDVELMFDMELDGVPDDWLKEKAVSCGYEVCLGTVVKTEGKVAASEICLGPYVRPEGDILASLNRHNLRLGRCLPIIGEEGIALLYRDTEFSPGNAELLLMENFGFRNISDAMRWRMGLSSETLQKAKRQDLQLEKKERLNKESEPSPFSRAKKVCGLLQELMNNEGPDGYYMVTDATVMLVKSKYSKKRPNHNEAGAYITELVKSSRVTGLIATQNMFGVRVKGPIGDLTEILEERTKNLSPQETRGISPQKSVLDGHMECRLESPDTVTLPDPVLDTHLEEISEGASIILAGGCFWGVQAVFEHVKGVTSAVSGYSGGTADSANYERISTGKTGHAESVRVAYDAAEITLGQVLKVFFSAAHDPTQFDRHEPDGSGQYRSAIFYATPREQEIAEAYIDQLQRAKVFAAPIATKVEPLKGFYPAEDYHQNYARSHPKDTYINQSISEYTL